MTTLVLVHGAFHGPWCFEPVLDDLAARGIEVVAPELPLSSHADDVAAVRTVLDGLDGPVAILGHSYGGAVITEAGNHLAVDRLIYLAAMAPDTGEPVNGGPVEIGADFITALVFGDDGLLDVDRSRATELFYPDAPADVAEAMAARLRRGATGRPGERITAAAWRSKRTDYVVCDADPIVTPASQLVLAERTGGTIHRMAGDHSPFAARPRELAELLADILAG